MKIVRWSISFLFALVLAMPAAAAEKTLTEKTGQEILKELREIRQLLQSQRKPAPLLPKGPQAPPPEIVSIKNEGIHVLGKADAPVVIVEFSDYQCPFCKRFYDTTFDRLKKSFIDTGKVRFISRELPLPFHEHAVGAAQAAWCAAEQGKFWEMKSLLFRDQNQLGKDAFSRFAKELSLKAGAFESCMDRESIRQDIAADASYAGSLGITGTPTFVIGIVKEDQVVGPMVVGAQPFPVFEDTINEQLGKNGAR